MTLAVAFAIAGAALCLVLLFDAARARRWADAFGWLVAALVFCGFAAGMVWIDMLGREVDCRKALATANAHRRVAHRPVLPDTCHHDPDQFERTENR